MPDHATHKTQAEMAFAYATSLFAGCKTDIDRTNDSVLVRSIHQRSHGGGGNPPPTLAYPGEMVCGYRLYTG